MEATEFVVTRNSRACEPVPDAPVREDGTLYRYCMRVGGWTLVWSDSVVVLAGFLTGDVDAYLAMTTEQERLVARIKASIGYQVKRQAVLNEQAMQDGRWDKCTLDEQAVLLGPRFEQPHGWNADLFDGIDWWLAPVDLLIIGSAYGNSPSQPPMPRTSGNRLLVVECETEEDWLETLGPEVAGVIELFWTED